jgi:hypothetical protein
MPRRRALSNNCNARNCAARRETNPNNRCYNFSAAPALPGTTRLAFADASYWVEQGTFHTSAIDFHADHTAIPPSTLVGDRPLKACSSQSRKPAALSSLASSSFQCPANCVYNNAWMSDGVSRSLPSIDLISVKPPHRGSGKQVE